MHNALKIILNIQELDMKMLRLLRLRTERERERKHIATLRQDLQTQLSEKEIEIADLNQKITAQENKILEIKDKIKKLETKQSTVKKVEEFNALTQEMSATERERLANEQITSDLIDKRNLEEEVLNKIKDSLVSSEESSKLLEKEIDENVKLLNKEGRELKAERDSLAKTANPEILKIYERLLKNKRDRVIVPIENRICSGCHIALTAQHENLVRKGERLVFCEHCSRILYWQELAVETPAEGEVAGKRRRRRATA